VPSKVAFDQEVSSLGRIRGDSISPPHTPASIKRRISRAEETPELVNADLYADPGDDPLKEGYISILGTDGPGLSSDEPMAIVLNPIVQVKIPIMDGRYTIKNRAGDFHWGNNDRRVQNNINMVHFFSGVTQANDHDMLEWTKWYITYNASNGNISIKSLFVPSWWAGINLNGSPVPVPWRLIPADGKFYYLTTEMNCASPNPLVPMMLPKLGLYHCEGTMAPLRKGDEWQMWEFIRV